MLSIDTVSPLSAALRRPSPLLRRKAPPRRVATTSRHAKCDKHGISNSGEGARTATYGRQGPPAGLALHKISAGIFERVYTRIVHTRIVHTRTYRPLINGKCAIAQ